MKEYEEILSDEFDEDNYSDEENKNEHFNINNINSNNFINIYKKFEVYFYIELNNTEHFIFPIESDLLNVNNQYISDLIKNIVKKINENSFIIKYNSTEFNLSLKENENDNEDNTFYINNYEVRLCKKKTLIPKFDLPNFSPNSLLSNIMNEKISFISKSPLNIMVRNKSIDNDYKICIKNRESYKSKNIETIKLNNNKEKYNKCFINKCILI